MSIRRINSTFISSFLLLVITLLFCTHDYNPFADLANARVHVLEWSFDGRDSVPVYSTGIMKTVVALSEEVDSFKITASKNRFWKDTNIRIDQITDASPGGPYLFSVSFFDTGLQKVTIQTCRSDDEVVSEEILVKVYCPLHQDTVAQLYGESFLLTTSGVPDPDAQYRWSFGPGREVSSLIESTSVTISSGQVAGIGALWITDLSNGNATPADSFYYTFDDTSKPMIYYFNDSLNRDTLFAGDTIFVFRVHIIDNLNQTVDTCSVNDAPFDLVNEQTNVYTKIFENMTQYTLQNGPLVISVYAMDNRQFRNVAQRTFWAFYDSSGEKKQEARVSISLPQNDSVAYNTSEITIAGIAENYQSETMILHIDVNDSISSDYKTIQGRSEYWQWAIRLQPGINRVIVSAYSTEETFLAADSIIIIHDPNFSDSIKPVIRSITASEGKTVENLMTSNTTEELTVVVFDEGSLIQSVLINGTPALQQNEDRSVWKAGTGTLIHHKNGNMITVEVSDISGNTRDSSFVIFNNTLPAFDQTQQIPSSFCAGTSYNFQISYSDADDDQVNILELYTPEGMSIKKNGRCTWKPTMEQLGTDSMVVYLQDGFEQSSDTTFTFTIVDCE